MQLLNPHDYSRHRQWATRPAGDALHANSSQEGPGEEALLLREHHDNRLNSSSPWHDETFPRPVPLGAGGSRSSAKGWIEYVIDEWLESRMEDARRI